ncbi:MAG: SatD family protein [Balneolaceae bacterium]|nr:SatD family protein [Balneolaceae bacterium]
MNTYIVIIGDIEQSKQLSPNDRRQVQNELESVFEELNRSSANIVSPYTITLGDEFQVVYDSAGEIFKHIWTIMAAVHPVFVRFSIGVGKITTGVNKRNSLGMDGPAFYKARECIEQMKKQKILLSVSTEKAKFNRLVNSAFLILEADLRSWKKNRFLILQKMYEEKEVKQIAKEIGLSDVAIYKNINAGTLKALRELTESISETIEEML